MRRPFIIAGVLIATGIPVVAGGVSGGLQWESCAGGRCLAVEPVGAGRPGFTSLAPTATGVNFVNLLPETRHLTNQMLLNGAGVTLADVDGDGRTDVYLGCSTGANGLYRNLGNWRFEDITAASGTGLAEFTTTGVAAADLDGDSDVDLVVNTFGDGTHLLLNDGHGVFTRSAQVLNPGRAGMTVALADTDGDGLLDLYACNYRLSALMDNPNARATFKQVGNKMVIDAIDGVSLTSPGMTNRYTLDAEGRLTENGEADGFYRNTGGGVFEAVPFDGGRFLDEAGKALEASPFEWGLTATFRDVNRDGRPDLYVCNDFQTPDRLWLNQGGGRFQLIPRLAIRKNALFSMAADFADFNRDGYLDFFTLDMMSREHAQRMRYVDDPNPTPAIPGVYADRPQYGRDVLFLNRGDDTFAEIAHLAGLEAVEWAWSCIFLDVDLDGWEDLLVANGMERAARDKDVAEYLKRLRTTRRLSDADIFRARRAFPRLATANLAFRNRGDLTFAEAGAQWGFDGAGVSQSMALGDLDNDGDLDVVINNLNAPPFLLRNDTPAARVGVRLKGVPPNTRGIGGRIWVRAPGLPEQSQEIIAGGRYLGGDDAIRAFAAGAATNRLEIEVLWPGGARSVLSDAVANRIYEFDEALASTAPAVAVEMVSAPWFGDVSDRLNHRHHEEDFNDFERQPLLPIKLSQLGPGVTWFDVNHDGWEDLLIPSGKGGRLGILTNNTQGGFSPAEFSGAGGVTARDQTTVLGVPGAGGEGALLIGESNYEEGGVDGAAVRTASPWSTAPKDWLPSTPSSPGPLAMADVDGDGDVDLFVGGRVIPGHYPEPATSRLFRNHRSQAQFTPDTANEALFREVGMVSGAAFTDLTGDGFPELVLACDWGAIRVFRNEGGRFTDWEVPLQWAGEGAGSAMVLSGLTGWWNSVAAGDFDGDGRMDLVAGNWGRNTTRQGYLAHPLRLYYGDLGGIGTVDLVEAHYDLSLGKWVPERQLDVLAASLPFLRGSFPTHRSFSTASIDEVLAGAANPPRMAQATWLQHIVLLNRDDHFAVAALPVEAQFAPVFGLAVGDFDGDARQDLFLAQNFFETEPTTPRLDAGRGLLLRGNGDGTFAPVSGPESGIEIYGEQRGAATADFDRDGRLDLAVAQNGAETRLFHNLGARPGLRVRLDAGPGNPTGLGTVLRGVSGKDGVGPAVEVHGGGGYWSQDSSVPVVTSAEPLTVLRIRWPGGAESRVNVPAGAKEIDVAFDGTVRSATGVR
ncbi:MAG: VCBS repeat-containing protein [Verrucomicrobiales bacterium]|nr:VCBS repeat-containing protein [Verrucomicrobiales bacterium]